MKFRCVGTGTRKTADGFTVTDQFPTFWVEALDEAHAVKIADAAVNVSGVYSYTCFDVIPEEEVA